MAATTTFPTNLNVQGTITATAMTLPANSVGNSQVRSDSTIDATKLQSRKYVPYTQANGTDVAAATAVVFIASAAATLQSVDVFNVTAATSTKTVTVDVQKSTGGGSFASILSAVVTINSSTAARTVSAGTITTPAIVDGDVLAVVVAVSGSGTQVQGLHVGLNIDENPA